MTHAADKRRARAETRQAALSDPEASMPRLVRGYTENGIEGEVYQGDAVRHYVPPVV